ncbi:alpha/beta fold hydrolase [Actinosynnema sp. NPDC047251]|uniref:AB hydrolase-1 domain-containing protein n=1 Tax=Saccharothrix espanaensis (strain ATCC 51144 / DSM 44229 / JCM 9112 / NBRC 15066 / NRRL 15764) TaxID=1179773 RepID=K0JXM7_SACES|nr:hypothetical protein BN6_53810 [Saccharothrix espanaensis DSM 44229]
MCDLDLLRRLLDREKIDWLGYSVGTWLGAQYATSFPTHVGRFVFNSKTELTTDWQGAFADFEAGVERWFREDFLPWGRSTTAATDATPPATRSGRPTSGCAPRSPRRRPC